MAVDHQGHFGEMGVGRASMGLVPELHARVGLIVQQPLDPSELAFREDADVIRDLGVLAFDDRPHASPLGRRPCPEVSGSDAGGRVADPPDRVYPSTRAGPQRSRATAMAETAAAPAATNADPHAARVAPVVTTSS